MTNVKNKGAVKNLASGMLKADKVRNVVAVIAIALTVFMMFVVFSVGINGYKDYDKRQFLYTGSSADIWLTNPTGEQLQILENKEYVEKVGIGALAAISGSEGGRIALYYGDETYFSLTQPALYLFKGSYPESESEIILSKNALAMLGIDKPVIGQEITVPYRTNVSEAEGVMSESSFTLTGWYDDSVIYEENVGMGFVAEGFWEESGNVLTASGIAQMAIDDNNMADKYADELELELNLGEGQRIKAYRTIGYDSEKLSLAAGIVLVIFFIILSGYLLIYNVFYLSITKDIRFYGLLKTIGTSAKQLKRIVNIQALKLSCIGIPAGLLAGSAVLWGLGNTDILAVESGFFNPLIFVFAVIFTLLTIFISVNKSAKRASGISPVEAVRFSGSTVEKKKKKKSSSGGKIYRMAYRNVFRDKKRAVVVMTSLFIGVTLFAAILTIVNAFDVENLVNSRIDAEIVITNDYEDDENTAILSDNLGEEFQTELAQIDGITDYYTTINALYGINYTEEYRNYYEYLQGVIGKNYTEEDLKNNFYGAVVGIDRAVLEEYYPDASMLDLDAFERGELVILNAVFEKYYTMPDQLTIYSRENATELTLTAAYLRHNLQGMQGMNGGEGPTLIVNTDLARQFTDQEYVSTLYINTQKGKEEVVQAELQSLVDSNDRLYLNSRTNIREENEYMKQIMTAAGGGLTFILAFVGIVNFVNIMISSVQSRKKELSVLESIGMTRHQVKQMIVGEGLYYGGITLTLVWTVGTGISYTLYVLFSSTVDYAAFHFPLVPMLIISILIFAICVIAPVMSLNGISKGSLTERIRATE